jgi:outer membrane protein OmpA-like peptidoglycan-associated protein
MRLTLLRPGALKLRLPLTTLALLMVVTGCAPVRPAPGALAPVHARISNEVAAADLATIDAWERRRVTLLRNDGADVATRTIVLARAGAWLVFAREAYVAHPRSQDADDALAEARRLMESLSNGAAGAPMSTAPTALLASAQTQNPELWERLREQENAPAGVTHVTRLADAEIELVRAASARTIATSSLVVLPTAVTSISVSKLACAQGLHVARAEQLLRSADEPLVALAGAPRPTTPEALRRAARTVHFALGSDVLGEPSAALLVGVADAMRDHSELTLVIEGHADPRGQDEGNLLLSGRRADGVRERLIGAGVDQNRVMVRMFGARQRSAAGTTALDYARDRRVQLKFVLPDGSELPVTEETLDLQIERARLWFGALRPGLRRYVPAPGSITVPAPVPVAPDRPRKKVRR